MSNGLLFIGVILLGFLLAWGVSIFNKNNRTSSNYYLDNWQIDLFEKMNMIILLLKRKN